MTAREAFNVWWKDQPWTSPKRKEAALEAWLQAWICRPVTTLKTSAQSGGVDADRLAVALYLWKVPSKPWHQLDEVDRTFWLGASSAILEFCKGNSAAFHALLTSRTEGK
jgi:hypothetical protein